MKVGKSMHQLRMERRQRELKECKHFTGIQNEKCSKGVAYDTVKTKPPVGMVQLACFCEGDKPCSLRECYTEADIKAREERFAKHLQDMMKAREAILATTGKQRGVSGVIDCPVCGKEKSLHFSVASLNGHVHARCKTDDCVAWME